MNSTMVPSSSNPPSSSQNRPKIVYSPPVLQSTPVSKIPCSTMDALTNLQDQVARLKQLKSYHEIQDQIDYDKTEVELSVWKNEYAMTASTLRKQLALELFSHSLIQCLIRQSKGNWNHHNDEDQYLPTTSSSQSPANVQTIQMHEIYSKLTCHPQFQQYLTYKGNESTKNILKMCCKSAVNAINKFEKHNDSAFKILHNLEKDTQELINGKGRESLELLKSFEQTNDQMPQDQISGRKYFSWSLAAPYHKLPGCTASKWQPHSLPFTFEQVRQSSWRDYELEYLKSAIVQTVVQAKVSAIKRRYNQLLMRIYYNVQNNLIEDRSNVQLYKSKYHFEETVSCGDRVKEYPIIFNLENVSSFPIGTKVRLGCDAQNLQRWRDERVVQSGKTKLEDIVNNPNTEINWMIVAAKMGQFDNFIRRTPEECSQTWYQVVLPMLKNKEWTLEQIKQLKAAVKQHGDRNWEKVAQALDLGFTSFQCFYTYERLRESTTSPSKKPQDLELGVAGFSKIVQLCRTLAPQVDRNKFAGVTSQVAQIVSSMPNVGTQQLAENYNRFSRPELVKGEFQAVEDLLLVVCIVKMRDYLKEARNFSPLKNYLPWRFINSWTVRADAIFRPWRATWSREEDLHLIDLVQEFESGGKKLDWKFISSHFDITKNRKNARGRYLLIKDRLQNLSFEEFREEYERNSPRITCSQRLENIVTQLKEVLTSPQSSVPTAETLQNPTQDDLQTYLNSFDKQLLERTISDLQAHIESRSTSHEQEEQIEPVVTKRSKPVDRRRFVRGDPESTASAIHLRKLVLISLEQAQPVNAFEAEVYKYFNTFKSRSIKNSTQHNYIPSAKELITMTEIQRIIDAPSTSNTKKSARKVTVEDLANSYAVSLDTQGFPILAETVAKTPILKKKTKHELKRDRRARMMKTNEGRIKKKTEEFILETEEVDDWVPEVKMEIELGMEDELEDDGCNEIHEITSENLIEMNQEEHFRREV